MFRVGLLLLTGPIRQVVESISNYFKTCNKNVIKCLYVKLEPDLSNPGSKLDISYLKDLSNFVPLVYSKASISCQNLDVRVLLSNPMKQNKSSPKYDIVFTNSSENDCHISNYIHKNLDVTYDSIVKLLDEDVVTQDNLNSPSKKDFQVYNTVCLGGTFDRLHNGHKVLLSESVLRASAKLIVGVTDISILKKKILWEMIEPVEKRILDVTKFLNDVDPSLDYEVVPITDPCGPAIINPCIECIIVSSETKVGGDRVNSERKNRGMNELSMHVVDLVENSRDSPGEEKKMSSSNTRMRLLGTCLKAPAEFSNGLYTILLQGCPLSGKSCIAYYFEKEGGTIISTKEIILSILSKEEEMNNFSLGFKENLLNENSIDYGKLVQNCLLNKEKRKWISNFLSHKVEEQIKKTIEMHQTQGKKCFLVQDSLLLELKLKFLNEVWSTILPTSEVETRLCKTYDLSTKDAGNVVSTLPSNVEYLEKSNRVFCNLWSSEATEQQVLRAWADFKVKL